MTIFTGVFVKIIYFFLSLIVWAGSNYLFVSSGIPTSISAILSFLAFIASLTVFFPTVRDVLEKIVDGVNKLT